MNSREHDGDVIGAAFSFAKSDAIWSAIELVTVKFAGVGLNDADEEVGGACEQFTAQQRRAASAFGDVSLLLARLQHSIMPSIGACRGIPASTPVARARITNSIVSRLAIRLTIFPDREMCQSINSDAESAVPRLIYGNYEN